MRGKDYAQKTKKENTKMDNRNSGLTPERQKEILEEVAAQRRAEAEAEKLVKRQQDEAAHEEGWKEMIESLQKIKNEPILILLRSGKAGEPVYDWFDNAAFLVAKYDDARFDTMRDTFIPTIKSLEDENARIAVADAMRFVFKLSVFKIDPVKYAKAVYAGRAFSKELGEVLGDSKAAKIVVVDMWKDAVYIRHRGAPVKSISDIFKKTWFEQMIADIKLEDPTYVAPKFRIGLIMGERGDD